MSTTFSKSDPQARSASRRGPRRASLVALAVTAAASLIAAGCTDRSDEPLGLGEQALGEVRTDLSCDELTDVAKAQLSEVVDTMDEAMVYRVDEDMAEEDMGDVEMESPPVADAQKGSPAPSTTTAGAEASEATGGEVIAGTNVREVGVDESDIVKTDGRKIVSVNDGVLRVVTLDGSPALDGSLPLAGYSGQAELFLRGDEAIVIMSNYGGIILDDVQPMPGPLPPMSSEGSSGDSEGVITPVPETVPETTVPETTVPETTVPETTVPETTVPETTVPETTVPETTVPETTTTTVPPEPIPFVEGVTLVRVDLSDPAHPSEVERSTVEGSLVAARMVDGTPRVVVRSTPPIINDIWIASDVAAAEEVIEDLDADDLLPRIALGDDVESLGSCEDVNVLPAVQFSDPAGADPDEPRMAMPPVTEPTTVSVLTVGDTLADLAPTTVEGMADVVYASPTALYVSATNWTDKGSTTAIHRFDTAGKGAATYTGSGAVPGVVLDDYSLSEAAGDLRVVTTLDNAELSAEDTPVDEPDSAPTTGTIIENPTDDTSTDQPSEGDVEVVTPQDDPDDDVVITEDVIEDRIVPPVPTTEGRLTILRPQDGGELVEIGHVDDLGEGESVQSVRFVGDIAYVVTFRQTDPLYAIDLSDPAHPKVLGELKVTGFSQYLHPVGDGLLLGLGREADESGFDEGFKVSLFDVTDPTAPSELDKIVIPDGWSLAADDPHAFTWDPVARHAIFPLERSGYVPCAMDKPCTEELAAPTQGALVVAVDGNDLAEVVELRHSDSGEWGSQILRSLVVDRDLWTLSGLGLGLSNADTPSTVELVRF